MKRRIAFSAAVALTMFLTASAQPQQPSKGGYGPRGYEERVAVRGKTTIQTAAGPKSVDLTVESIAIPNGSTVKLDFPEKGFILLQNAGAAITISVGDVRRKPREGEWMSIPLPASIVLTTDDDTVVLEAIIVRE